MRRSAAIGILSLAAIANLMLPSPSTGSDSGEEDVCRLAQRAPVHWLRPLSDRHPAMPAGKSRLLDSG